MYDMIELIILLVSLGVASVVMIICYIIESLFLAKIASKRGENPLLAWIPVVNYVLLRNMAGKKSCWQWLVGFVVVALLGNSVGRFLGIQALIWCSTVWYWTAFHVIMEEETELEGGWFFSAIFCLPVKLYVMYKMGE